MLKDYICFRKSLLNITMFAFLRATQQLGVLARQESRLSIRMLSKTSPVASEAAMPLPTHDKVELVPARIFVKECY